ncbi:hypothetical protein NUU61_004671 [Penicillium alfredii]|uniref:Uncharacterized protein n=1 Tax=Penicillium alfredii TaxID=1506179 RepID=A0A9W9F7Z6_9EURO|nr:uncharacterized protein NUU61_004671 [Penicillium alfredii]KAJ5095315.1 hypothetical protein NUU61_004671 [Penicillium alfredii]
MTAGCIHTLQPFPKDMLEMQEEATKHADASSGFWLLGVLATRCVNLLSNVSKTKGMESVLSLVEEGIVLQQDFQHVLGLFTQHEPYTTTREIRGDPVLIYDGRIDLYMTPWAIRVWNNSRMLQVVVCEVLFHLMNRILDANITPVHRAQIMTKLHETFQILSTLGDDMLATVPQALGVVSSAPDLDLYLDLPARVSVSRGYMVVWSLYTVGKSPVTRSETRKWIITILKHVGHTAGIAMALRFADDVDEIDKLADHL